MSKRLEAHKILVVDCDDTLVLWDRSEYPDLKPVEVTCYGQTSALHAHDKNVNLVRKFHKLGYTIIIWSQTGSEWAEAVGRALGLDECVYSYMTKPMYYLDDLPADSWMKKIWRDPRGGHE